MAALRRPGGVLAARPLHFIWIVDCSGSMYGEKIKTINQAIRSATSEMAVAAGKNPYAQLLIRTLKFATGASWVTPAPVPIGDFVWRDLEAGGVTDMGKAFEMLAAQLTIPPMTERALPPVLVLISDGQPTDEYMEEMKRLVHLPWGRKAVRIAISIGQDTDNDVLEQFTGDPELVLQANNPGTLVKMIKWVSTVATVISATANREFSDPDDESAFSFSENSASMVLNTSQIAELGSDGDDDVW